jgi:hypothetical protein
MKFYTYKNKTIKNKNLPYQSFQFFFKSWNLNQMFLKCALVYYGMIMLMIMIFLVEKCSFFEDLFGLNVFLII